MTVNVNTYEHDRHDNRCYGTVTARSGYTCVWVLSLGLEIKVFGVHSSGHGATGDGAV